jgi:hypothetical protein
MSVLWKTLINYEEMSFIELYISASDHKISNLSMWSCFASSLVKLRWITNLFPPNQNSHKSACEWRSSVTYCEWHSDCCWFTVDEYFSDRRPAVFLKLTLHRLLNTYWRCEGTWCLELQVKQFKFPDEAVTDKKFEKKFSRCWKRGTSFLQNFVS